MPYSLKFLNNRSSITFENLSFLKYSFMLNRHTIVKQFLNYHIWVWSADPFFSHGVTEKAKMIN